VGRSENNSKEIPHATGRSSPVVVSPVRLAVDTLVPHVAKAMGALDAGVRKVSVESALLELVRLRASQINGCAHCVDMHSGEARKAGESEQRLYAFAVWAETLFFTARERAVLALTEAMTKLSQDPVPDEVYSEAATHFSQTELAELIWAIAVINTWNRLGATARPWPLA
jgi:AhpD family alkylhydroperoxidase